MNQPTLKVSLGPFGMSVEVVDKDKRPPPEPIECDYCDGTGQVVLAGHDVAEDCFVCNGSGVFAAERKEETTEATT